MITDRPAIMVGGKEYVRVCKSIEVSTRSPLHIEFEIEHDVAFFRMENVVYAISNVCPHKRASVLSTGFVDGAVVTCPLHGRRYNVVTGENLTQGRGVSTYPVLELDGYVWINIHGASTPVITP
ncbi:MAG: nitrite reductase (NAD(P)H) small subunit [Ignavibacteria bacterium]|nr:nitrite reductase (NAD(P)H) small subunit [Ignavibacteria bacterium]